MKSCKDVVPNKEIKVVDFLLKHTPVYSTWIIAHNGWREAIFWIDHEDLWVAWYPKQHDNAIVKSYSYDEETKTGWIEYIENEVK